MQGETPYEKGMGESGWPFPRHATSSNAVNLKMRPAPTNGPEPATARRISHRSPISIDTELVPGVTAVVTVGHTRCHQSVKIESEGQVAFFLGDLIPTVSHLPLPYIMGYDLFPIQTLETKRWVLDRAFEERWLLLFEHDPAVQAGHVQKDQEGKYVLREVAAWQ
jgi:glyoxylase-like metal-dependent hydrolase (beta-lactamase superfamily II)